MLVFHSMSFALWCALFPSNVLNNRLQNPEFVEKVFAEKPKKEIALVKVAEIKKFGKEYIEVSFFKQVCMFCIAFWFVTYKNLLTVQNKVLTHVRIKSVDETTNWCYLACTGCRKEIKTENSVHVCEACNRLVPYPEIR